jgi:hypothetical protein
MNGETEIIWTTYFPGGQFHPLNIYPLEALGTVGYVFGIMLSECCTILFSIKYVKQKTTNNLIKLTSSTMWAIYFSFHMLYWYILVDTVLEAQIYRQIRDMFFNLASIITVLFNFRNLIQIILKPKKWLHI